MSQIERPVSYWREVYLLHANSLSFGRKVTAATETVEKFLTLDLKSQVGFSAGKDSSVLVHLVSRIDNSIPAVSVKDDMDFPGEEDFVRDFCARCAVPLEILSPPVSLWDVVKNFDFTEDIHSKLTEFSERYFYDLLRKFQQDNGFTGVFLGLRAQESKGRRFNFLKRGKSYWNKTWGQQVCQPLADWTAADVFAYLFKHELPILPVYFKTKYKGSPESIRKSWVLPSGQSQFGEAQWLKHYYPEIFYKLAAINPKLRCYV